MSDLLTSGQPIERDEFLAQEWPRDYLISEGLLALQGGSMLIGGEAGKGKSILALQAAQGSSLSPARSYARPAGEPRGR